MSWKESGMSLVRYLSSLIYAHLCTVYQQEETWLLNIIYFLTATYNMSCAEFSGIVCRDKTIYVLGTSDSFERMFKVSVSVWLT